VLLKGGKPTPPPQAPEPSGYQLDLTQVPFVAPEALPGDTVGLFFCLDTSGSMARLIDNTRKIDISKAAMQHVVAQIAAYTRAHPQKQVKVGVCAFSDQATVVQPLKAFDPDRLSEVIQSLQPSGNTAIGEALSLALQGILATGVETKAILVMTDGENNRGVSPEQVVEAIKHNRNNRKVHTADIHLFLVAFDIQARVFDGVKKAGAVVKESRDQKSLEEILQTLVAEVLLEKPQ
jgi:uncharacterized protein YegL